MSHLPPPPAGSGRRSTPVLAVLALVLALALVLGMFWWTGRDGDPVDPAPADAASSGPASVTDPVDRTPSDLPTIPALPRHPRVVVVSIDGLASYAVTAELMPVLTGLLARGAGTLNARTEAEMTVTLPNHTGMVTSRRIDAAAGGHGVTWNEPSPRNVRAGVASVFSVIAGDGGDSAVFTGKEKFEMWDRSWPRAIDRFEVEPSLVALTAAVVADLEHRRRDLTFVHVAEPDVAGHAHGWGSRLYDDAVQRADAALGQVVRTIEADPQRARRTILIVTADHGGRRGEPAHEDAAAPDDYTIPFVVWGPGVVHADLYRINPDYRDPGTGRPSYAGPQPVRNAAVGNLVLDLLGLPPIPGSQVDAQQDLAVH